MRSRRARAPAVRPPVGEKIPPPPPMSVPHHARHRVAPIPGDAMHAPPGNGDDLDESNDTALTRTRARVASFEIATHRGTADSNQRYSCL